MGDGWAYGWARGWRITYFNVCIFHVKMFTWKMTEEGETSVNHFLVS